MRSGRPSNEQLRRNFDTVLAEALSGEGMRTDTGLDDPTENALWEIVTAYPRVSEELVAAARRAFEGQLDGSNVARWHEELARKMAEYGTGQGN